MDKDLTPFETKALAVLENKRFWILIGAICAIVIAAAIGKYFVEENQKKKERLAAEKLFEVEKLESEGVTSNNRLFSQEYVKARIEWTAEKKGQMQQKLEEVIKEFPETGSAQAARLRLASLAFQDAKFDEALKTYDEVISKGTNKLSDVPVVTAKLGKGYSLESMEKYPEALAVYDGITKNETDPTLAEALLSKARVLKALSRQKEVDPILNKLETDYPGTFYEEAARAMKITLND